jgi:hypothetical protein
MRFYQQQHAFYCGVDLHARTTHVCVVNQDGHSLVYKDIPLGHTGFWNGCHAEENWTEARCHACSHAAVNPTDASLVALLLVLIHELVDRYCRRRSVGNGGIFEHSAHARRLSVFDAVSRIAAYGSSAAGTTTRSSYPRGTVR